MSRKIGDLLEYPASVCLFLVNKYTAVSIFMMLRKRPDTALPKLLHFVVHGITLGSVVVAPADVTFAVAITIRTRLVLNWHACIPEATAVKSVDARAF